MSDSSELTRFLDSPELLSQLCKNVIARLDERRKRARLDEQEKQLNEIARTIEKLEKAGVAELAVRDEINNKLEKLAHGLEEVLQDLRPRIGKSNSTTHQKTQTKKRSQKPKTSKEILRKEIIKALNTLGGTGRVRQVLAEMGKQLNGKLLPRDIEAISSGDLVWENNACWERHSMVKDGILKNDSPRGIWELSRG